MEDFNPKRIASLQPSATSTLDSLGLIERVVACTRHCFAVSPHLSRANVAVIEDSWTAQAEQIIAAEPDLVITSVPYQAEAVAQILAAGIRVLALAPRSLFDVYADIVAIGNLTGAGNGGIQLVREMQEKIASVRQRTEGKLRARVFCEEWGKPIMASQPWVAELIDAAGGIFIGHPGAAIEPESIQDAAPEVLIFAWCGVGDRVPMEKVIKEREWKDMPAVACQRVFTIRDEVLTTPGPPLVTGLLALAHAMHPDLFPSAPDFMGTKIMRRLGPPVLK